MHVRAEARLSAYLDGTKPELGTWRQHYEREARRGNRKAEKKLHPPPCPDAIEHLVAWTFELYGRDGFNMGGPNLLSNRELRDFFALRGIVPDPLEVDALFVLNAAYCNPDGGEEDEAEERRSEPQIPSVQPGRQVIPV